jgi:hypothetical protein
MVAATGLIAGGGIGYLRYRLSTRFKKATL